MYATHCLDLMYIPIKFHEDIQKATELWVCKNFWGKNGEKLSKGHNLETKYGEQSFTLVTHHLYLIHIPINFQEDIQKGNRVMVCTRMQITQNKHKNNQRAITLKQKSVKQQ